MKKAKTLHDLVILFRGRELMSVGQWEGDFAIIFSWRKGDPEPTLKELRVPSKAEQERIGFTKIGGHE